LRAIGSDDGRAIYAQGEVDIAGPLTVAGGSVSFGINQTGGVRGYSDAVGDDVASNGVGVLGVGTSVGVLAQGRTGATALKAVAPAAGRAIDAIGRVTLNGPSEVLNSLNVTGNLVVGGAIGGTFPAGLARRDQSNTFTRQNTMRRRLRLRGGLSSRSAGRIRLAKDAKTVDVNLPVGVTIGPKAAILVTPIGVPFVGSFFVARIGPRTFRIRALEPAPRSVLLSWAVFN
jgi:hypothetical protein